MNNLNFVRGRWKRQQALYLGIDIAFLAIVAFLIMFLFSMVLSWSSTSELKMERYAQAKVNDLARQSSEYEEIKNQRDKLLDMSSDLANIRASQYYILLGLEKISNSVTDQLYITNINYVSATDSMILTGEVKDLRLLSVFMKNLEIEFKVKKVELKNLGSEKDGQRSFTVEFKFGEDNAFKGDTVE